MSAKETQILERIAEALEGIEYALCVIAGQTVDEDAETDDEEEETV